MQKLAEGQSFSVQTSNYAIKVGMDIDVYLLGRKDWSEFVDAISVAFQEEVQMDMFTSFIEADNKLPTQDKFVITDELTKENKSKFDELIEDVEAANAGADVVILGLKSDLQKLERLQDVDWIADSQKEERARLGRLGSYGVTTLLQRNLLSQVSCILCLMLIINLLSSLMLVRQKLSKCLKRVKDKMTSRHMKFNVKWVLL